MSKSTRPADPLDSTVRYIAPIVLIIAALLAIYLSVRLTFDPGFPGDRTGDMVDLATVLWVAVVIIIIVPSIGTRKPKEDEPPIPGGGGTTGGG